MFFWKDSMDSRLANVKKKHVYIICTKKKLFILYLKIEMIYLYYLSKKKQNTIKKIILIRKYQ